MSTEPERLQSDPGHQTSKSPRAIVAEHDDAKRKRLCDLLKSCGYVVDEARTGTELLEILKESAGSPNADRALDLIVANVEIPDYLHMGLVLGLRVARTHATHIAISELDHRRFRVVCYRTGGLSTVADEFDIEGLRDLVLGLHDERYAPISLRVTLRPSTFPTERPTSERLIPVAAQWNDQVQHHNPRRPLSHSPRPRSVDVTAPPKFWRFVPRRGG